MVDRSRALCDAHVIFRTFDMIPLLCNVEFSKHRGVGET